MHITVIGASAGVGLEAVKRALQRQHKVTTLSRTEIQISDLSNLNIIKGSATNRADVLQSLQGADAVIVALGTGNSMKATTLYSDFATLLVEVMEKKDIQIPVIILTGFGAGDSGKYNNFAMKLFFRFLLKEVYEDKTKMEEIIAASGLQWEIVRPGILNDKPLTEKYRIEATLYEGINIGSIHRADVADFMVKQAENPTYLHQYISLSNK